MEEERNQGQSVVSGEEGREVEVKDRGLFDFMGKKEEKEKEKSEEEADLVAGMEKVRVDEVEDTKEEEKKKKEGFLEKLRRSHSSSSSSSSSSDEEGGGGEGSENKEKKKKKKGLKEKLEHKEEEKGEEEEEEKEPVLVVAQEEFVEAVPAYDDDTAVTVEVVEGTAKVDGAPEGGEKKGFLEKIKEKLPGHKKPGEEPAAAAAAAAPAVETAADECAKESNDHTAADAHEGKENKKGFLGKIMEKLPGYGKGGEEKEREPEKTSACN